VDRSRPIFVASGMRSGVKRRMFESVSMNIPPIRKMILKISRIAICRS
jgi:hypothetical protein